MKKGVFSLWGMHMYIDSEDFTWYMNYDYDILYEPDCTVLNTKFSVTLNELEMKARERIL